MTNYQRALDEVGHHSVTEQGARMTVEQIADRMGEPNLNRLRKILSAYDDSHPLNAAKVVPLTLATRNLALVRYFAEAVGCVLVELPKVGVENLDVMAHAGNAAREFADVMAEAGKALADGRVSRDEAQAFRKQANELITVVCQFADLLDVKAGLQPPPTLHAVPQPPANTVLRKVGL